MIRRPPRSTRTDTLFPYTTLFRSGLVLARHIDDRAIARDAGRPAVAGAVLEIEIIAIGKAGGRPDPRGPRAAFGWGERVDSPFDRGKVGRAMQSRKRRVGDFPMENDQDAGGRLKQPEDSGAEAQPSGNGQNLAARSEERRGGKG